MSEAADTMTGLADATENRVRARRRAEARFRLYGLIAIGAALSALAVLVVSIVIEALPAFTEHRLTLEMTIDEEVIDPRGRIAEAQAATGLSAEERAEAIDAAIRRANFTGLLRQSLLEAFPGVTDRRAQRDLAQMVSPINAAVIARRVARDPSLIGSTGSIEMPISDDVDQYLQGAIGRERFRTTGPAQPSGTSGEIEIEAARENFDPVLQRMRDRFAAEAERLEAAAARAERRLAALPADDESVAGERQQAELEAARLRDRAATYRSRAAGSTDELNADLPSVLISINGGVVRASAIEGGRVRGEALVNLENADEAAPGEWTIAVMETAEADRRISDRQIAYADVLQARGQIAQGFNWTLFTNADSRDPELAGVRGAFIGSLLTMLVTMVLAAPVAVLAAIYLEEFAPRNWVTGLIEVNINNLAAVPSIVFGLLGLAVFINFMGLPRSAPLVGGLVLALMTLPTIIIATRAALKAVPPSVRQGALGLGASPVQSVFHHVLPLAMPGILTGSIIGLAQALGETAPLLMIGMVAFVADAPSGFTDAATVLPVQVYIWSSAAERAFEARTSAAIIVLLSLMIALNLLAVYVRRRFERRW